MADVSAHEVEKIAFESKQPDRGYTCKASYLKAPNDGDALIEIFKDGVEVRSFFFPAYKIWNIPAHFSDIVDDEIRNDGTGRGYGAAASTGIHTPTIILEPKT